MSENNISNFVKYNRQKSKMTQEDLAGKAGVGLRFIRDLEQGKESLRVDKVNQVLALFGYNMAPVISRLLDPWEIILKESNIPVRLVLKNKVDLYGIILEPISDAGEIKSWKFLSNNNAKKYKETKDLALITIVNHADIQKIENQ